jgi:glucose/arabinose dehydrogenase
MNAICLATICRRITLRRSSLALLGGKVTIPDVLLQPHSAPLGLAFNEGNQFPATWKGDAFVALHGATARS